MFEPRDEVLVMVTVKRTRSPPACPPSFWMVSLLSEITSTSEKVAIALAPIGSPGLGTPGVSNGSVVLYLGVVAVLTVAVRLGPFA